VPLDLKDTSGQYHPSVPKARRTRPNNLKL